MAKLTTIQSYKSVSDLKEHWRCTLPKPFEWRLLALPVVGSIHGLPTTQGTAIATNGILVAIEQMNTLFIGHLDSFEPDEQEFVVVIKQAKTGTTKKAKEVKPKTDISEFY